jgi:hypothetical protein
MKSKQELLQNLYVRRVICQKEIIFKEIREGEISPWNIITIVQEIQNDIFRWDDKLGIKMKHIDFLKFWYKWHREIELRVPKCMVACICIKSRVNPVIMHKGINLDNKKDGKPFTIKKKKKHYKKEENIQP